MSSLLEIKQIDELVKKENRSDLVRYLLSTAVLKKKKKNSRLNWDLWPLNFNEFPHDNLFCKYTDDIFRDDNLSFYKIKNFEPLSKKNSEEIVTNEKKKLSNKSQDLFTYELFEHSKLELLNSIRSNIEKKIQKKIYQLNLDCNKTKRLNLKLSSDIDCESVVEISRMIANRIDKILHNTFLILNPDKLDDKPLINESFNWKHILLQTLECDESTFNSDTIKFYEKMYTKCQNLFLNYEKEEDDILRNMFFYKLNLIKKFYSLSWINKDQEKLKKVNYKISSFSDKKNLRTDALNHGSFGISTKEYSIINFK